MSYRCQTITALVVVGVCVVVAQHCDLRTKSEDADDVFILDGYEKAHAPLIPGVPFNITVNMDIWAVNGISVQNQDIEVDLILTVKWTDCRLKLAVKNYSRTWVRVDKDEVDKIWTPTLLYENCRGCKPICLCNGDVYVNKDTLQMQSRIRSQERFTCPMDLIPYPMDRHSCNIRMYTYQDNITLITLQHLDADKKIIPRGNLTLHGYNVYPVIKSRCFAQDFEKEVFSCLEYQVNFEHRIIHRLITSYLPSACMVFTSWISFWLPVDQAPARVALGLLPLLSLITMLVQTEKDLPHAACVKAIDVWMFICILLVDLSLFEFAVSYCLSKRNKQVQHETVENNETNGTDPDDTPLDDAESSCKGHESIFKCCKLCASTFLDKRSPWGFLILFATVIIFYWLGYEVFYYWDKSLPQDIPATNIIVSPSEMY